MLMSVASSAAICHPILGYALGARCQAISLEGDRHNPERSLLP